MRLQWSCRATAIAVLVVWLGMSVWPSSARAETYGGSATAVVVTVPATGTVIRAATGALSISGGGEEASLLVGDIPSNLTGGAVALSAGVLHSAIVGVGSATAGAASLGDVTLTVSGNQITTDFVAARSRADCGPDPRVGGDSRVENLVINGQPITVTGAPNQTVTLPNGTAIINEQVSSIVGNTGELTVNALHVTTHDAVTGAQLADVVLATADSKHGCEEEPPASQTFTKGHGWIPGQPSGKAKFGIFAGLRQDLTPKGHVVFKDASANFSMKSTSITSYSTAGCDASFSGTGDSNYGPVQFTVTVTDGGEPGSRDIFSIQVSGSTTYAGADNLGGGNIEVEGMTCPQ